MADMVEVQIAFKTSTEDAEQVKALVPDGQGELVDVSDRFLVPLFVAVLGGSIAAAAVAQILNYIIDKDTAQQIIDVRGGKVNVVVSEKIRNGKVIIIADDKTQVTIDKVPELLDLTDIAKTAVTSGAEAAKKAVEAAGGTATVEDRDDTDDSTDDGGDADT